ncbi:MAG: hypothetical protein GVY12_06580 [Bacteroidetes bacterium]|jgi:hypothetical protein|nr:hypothetical protein [Bacteroidota bacterium]
MHESIGNDMLEMDVVVRWMIAGLIVVISLGYGGAYRAHAQPTNVSLTSQQLPTRITLQPTFQRYIEDAMALSEWSLPLTAFVPIQNNLILGLSTGLAQAGGDNFTTVAGRTDLQATVSYTRSVREGSLILNVGVNLPSGSTALTPDEFETITQLSQNFYPFQMPGFGQGFNISPGATWAVPAGERVMVGIGASYQLRGGFTPVTGMDESYDPGNEVRLTSGIDIQIRRNQAVSGDLTVTLYGNDMLGETEQFGPGSKVSATAQYRQDIGFNTVRIVARYQSQAKSSLPAATGMGTPAAELQVIPTQGTTRVLYRYRVQDGLDITWRAEGRFFGETAVFSSKSLFTAGVEPAFALENRWTLRPQLAYTLGSFTGVDVGLGIDLEL